MIDIHCHILPGIDDGPASWEESLAMARQAAADGIRCIVATPHVEPSLDYPKPAQIQTLVQQLNDKLAAENISLSVFPGAELPALPELLEALSAGRVLTLGAQSPYVLVELYAATPSAFYEELFFRMQLAGYIPVIAHIERIMLLRTKPHILQEWRARGYRLQMNASSLCGSWLSRRYARRLLQRGYVDILASDGHDVSRRPPVLSCAQHALRRQPELFAQLTRHNPGEIVGAFWPSSQWEEK